MTKSEMKSFKGAVLLLLLLLLLLLFSLASQHVGS